MSKISDAFEAAKALEKKIAEKLAADKAAKAAAEKAAAEKAAKAKADKLAADKAASMQATADKARAAAAKAEQEAAVKAKALEEKAAATKAAKAKADKEIADKAAAEKAAREKSDKIAKDKADKVAADKAAADKAAADKTAAEKKVRDDAAAKARTDAAEAKAKRDADLKAAMEKNAKDAAAKKEATAAARVKRDAELAAKAAARKETAELAAKERGALKAGAAIGGTVAAGVGAGALLGGSGNGTGDGVDGTGGGNVPPPIDTDGDGIPDNIDATPNGEPKTNPDTSTDTSTTTSTTTVESGGNGTSGGPDVMLPDGDGGVTETEVTPKVTPEIIPDNSPVDVPPGGGPDVPKGNDYADALAMLRLIFEQYGLGDLAGTIESLLKSGKSANESLMILKYDKSVNKETGQAWNSAYSNRFAGNVARVNNGLNALSEAQYMALEDSYAETLKSYGITSMLSSDRKTNEARFATYIAGDISATEFADRIKTVEDRVINANPETLSALKQFYPELTDKDLVAYFLDPKEVLPVLKQKTTAAEIGGAALGQGLTADVTTATDLAKYGVDLAGARAGYANVAEVLPTSGKLSNIYQEAGIDYTQKTGEEEFMKNNVTAAEQRKRLKSMERAKFMGDSGVSSQAGSLNRSIQGAF